MNQPLSQQSIDPVVPPLADAMHQLDELARLEPDWDSYGAAAISPDTIALAHHLIATLAERRHIRPDDLFPMNSGAVQVQWRHEDRLLTVEVSAAAPFRYLFVEGSGADRRAVEQSGISLDAIVRVAAKLLTD